MWPKATLDFFQQAYEDHIKKESQKEGASNGGSNSNKSSGSKNSNFKNYVNKSPSSAVAASFKQNDNNNECDQISGSSSSSSSKSKDNRVWLISPLIDKLPSSVKGRILKNSSYAIR